MALETTKLNPRIVLAVASTLCATSMAQDTPAKPPEAPAPAAEKPATAAALKAADAAAPAADEGKPKLPAQAVPAPAELDTMSLLGKDRATSNVTINLINRMVKKGLLDKEEAADLIAQSEQDVVIARNQVRDDAQIATQMVIQEAVTRKVIPNLDPMFDDALRVTYIPETVKKQIKDDLRAELAAEAKTQGTALPKGLPEWITRFRVKGDIRIRYENDSFPSGNDNTGAFPNFNAINTGAPFDVAGTVFSPQLNVDRDRTRIRIRARIGAEMDLGEGFTAGMRIGTGENNTPTSMNQSLGAAGQGQGGNFSKYAIWLDRAFLKYEVGADPDRHLAISAGRFDNPFYTVDQIVWDEDVGFDGVGFTARYRVAEGVVPFLTGGAYPVFNTDFNFSSNQPSKFKSTDKYLYGAQLGVEVKLPNKFQFKVAGAYYYFDGVEGRLSTPYTPLTASDASDTDGTRPSFAQKGNTYTPLRNIVADASNNFGTINQWQYFGLASKFRPVVLTGQIDYNGFEPVQISLMGEYVKNLGFNRRDIAGKAVNNFSAVTAANPNGAFAGGDTAWYLGLRAGHPVLQKRGQWQAGVNYRYIESDAVIDGFNDSDFGHGGTNMKGYTLWGTYATSARTSLSMRWMSASEIAGPPLKSDIFMIDFGGKF
ncbi:MAG: putative porin [Verrucomicrobia bacterium]|nr:putative porin [Verrucomicrobiota bacterium]